MSRRRSKKTRRRGRGQMKKGRRLFSGVSVSQVVEWLRSSRSFRADAEEESGGRSFRPSAACVALCLGPLPGSHRRSHLWVSTAGREV